MKPKLAPADFAAFNSFEQLRGFVRDTLCRHDRLDARQAPLYEAPIKQGGVTRAYYFEVRGPRLLCSHAIWVCDEHRILFYDSRGARFAEIRLTEAPKPDPRLTTTERMA